MALTTTYSIESLLAARLFISPQLHGQDVYFISDLSGRLSLYRMPLSGGIPQPLLPPGIAMQNPKLVGAISFAILPKSQQILVVLDAAGNECYQPFVIPLQGGLPKRLLADLIKEDRAYIHRCDAKSETLLIEIHSQTTNDVCAYRVNLDGSNATRVGQSVHGAAYDGGTEDHRRLFISHSYTFGDHLTQLWQESSGRSETFLGVSREEQPDRTQVAITGAHSFYPVDQDQGVLFISSLFNDHYGIAYSPFTTPAKPQAVAIVGLQGDEDQGELEKFKQIGDDLFYLHYNVDGCCRIYECSWNKGSKELKVERTLVGGETLTQGVVESISYNKELATYALSFSTATSPAQLFIIAGEGSVAPKQLTNERILGIDSHLLSSGEDASFESHDGLRISARLYQPAKKLGFTGKRPLVVYVHGGPQSQERPDFAWFSMPLIQYLTLQGFAVFVPNVRGSSGYGVKYMKQVDNDWGGKDRLDHVEGLKHLRQNFADVDVDRAGVMGRSYGGYMTLTLASRHADLWKASIDMFGPFDLVKFAERIPETWKEYFYQVLGHPERDLAELKSRSPKTYIDGVQAPMLVIQGKNDPRVVEAESTDLVEHMRQSGKEVDYLLFEDEGHDVLKYNNKVTCYERITDFFTQHLTS